MAGKGTYRSVTFRVGGGQEGGYLVEDMLSVHVGPGIILNKLILHVGLIAMFTF